MATSTSLTKSFESSTTHVAYRSPQHLAYAYFLGALLGREGRQPKQAQAGHEDGYPGEDAQDGALLLLGLVEVVVHLVEELVGEGVLGSNLRQEASTFRMAPAVLPAASLMATTRLSRAMEMARGWISP
jgi:hypothetical protein